MSLKQPHNVPVSARGYKLAHDYTYQWKIGRESYRINIPEGFLYDGASVPRLVWTITGLRPDGLLRAAATVHDFLYEHKGYMPKGAYQLWDDGMDEWVDAKKKWSRKSADKMFARLLREAGVSKVKRRMAYKAVRIGGGLYWRT